MAMADSADLCTEKPYITQKEATIFRGFFFNILHKFCAPGTAEGVDGAFPNKGAFSGELVNGGFRAESVGAVAIDEGAYKGHIYHMVGVAEADKHCGNILAVPRLIGCHKGYPVQTAACVV